MDMPGESVCGHIHNIVFFLFIRSPVFTKLSGVGCQVFLWFWL